MKRAQYSHTVSILLTLFGGFGYAASPPSTVIATACPINFETNMAATTAAQLTNLPSSGTHQEK
jgi:hypothetical protein